jgi:hypothetical protein
MHNGVQVLLGHSLSTEHGEAAFGPPAQPKSQSFGFVCSPGFPQLLPAPQAAGGQICPSFAPPMQRLAPQIPPPGQSALLPHGAFGCVPPAQVSHGQLNCS